jgi:hypothetical protein
VPDAIPYAHLGHYLWILYVLPVLIVVASIIKTTLSEKREAREKDDPPAGGAGEGPRTDALRPPAGPSPVTGPAAERPNPSEDLGEPPL